MIDLIYRLWPPSPDSAADYLFLLHGIEYHRTRRVNKANLLGQMILEQNQEGKAALTFPQLEALTINAAYAQDANTLTRILNLPMIEECPSGFREYVLGLLSFGVEEESRAWLRHLCDSHEIVANLESGELSGEYVEHVSSYFSSAAEFVSILQSERKFDESYQARALESVRVVISCDVTYFEIWSRYYCSRFRRRNSEPLDFYVVVSDASDVSRARAQLGKLQRFGKVGLSCVEIGEENLANFAATYRFMCASSLMKQTQDTIVISDIDINPSFRLDEIISALPSDFGCIRQEGNFVPWARLNAGPCVFKHSPEALSYLETLRDFLHFALRNGAKWTVDQAAMHLIWEQFSKEGRTKKMTNLLDWVSLDNLRRTPGRLERKKFHAKSRNLKGQHT